jgi:hypothetical protein
VQGPVAAAVVSLNASVDNLNAKQPILSLEDPTNADPRIPAPGADGKRPTTPAYDSATKQIRTLPNYLLWMVFLFAFSYCGANMPIWRFAQPVNYIGFWVMLITIVLSAIGAVVAPLTGVLDAGGKAIGAFALTAVKDLGFMAPTKPFTAWQPLWPMLFVTSTKPTLSRSAAARCSASTRSPFSRSWPSPSRASGAVAAGSQRASAS